MGTSVDTCLSLGGIFDEDAGSALLDVNKRVVYARDADDRIVARQLVVWTEDDRLLCCQVYPVRQAETLGEAFLEWDRDFASALGADIVTADEGYETALILSRTWWDDGPWDVFVAST